LRSLQRWAKRFPERRWAVENAGGLGRHLARRLAAAGESVVDVPPKFSARVRVLSSFAGNARKNDGLDALATALAASRNERLAAVNHEVGSEVLRDVRTLDRKIADLNGRIEAEVEASGTTLTEIFGIGPILAARIIGAVGDVARFPTKAHFASYAGTAPVEASSGDVVRHRLSLGGNRKLNNAVPMVATCQARSDARGGAYRKKLAEGKSRKEALRCLKRRVCDAVFRNLMADSRAHSRSAA
jgi:transposase